MIGRLSSFDPYSFTSCPSRLPPTCIAMPSVGTTGLSCPAHSYFIYFRIMSPISCVFSSMSSTSGGDRNSSMLCVVAEHAANVDPNHFDVGELLHPKANFDHLCILQVPSVLCKIFHPIRRRVPSSPSAVIFSELYALLLTRC